MDNEDVKKFAQEMVDDFENESKTTWNDEKTVDWFYERLLELRTKIDFENYHYQKKVYDNRNELVYCPVCRSKIADRIVTIYESLIESLKKVYEQCKQNKCHEFKMSDIRGLLNKNDYARWGDLVWFGGLVIKNGKSNYTLNMERCEEFFKGNYKIPSQITIDQIEHRVIEKNMVDINHFPKLSDLLDDNNLYQDKLKI